MKIELDENLPVQLANKLRALGHDVETVPEEGMAGYEDADTWVAAKCEQRFLPAQGLDFSNVTAFVPGTHPGIRVKAETVRIASCSRTSRRSSPPS